MPRRSTPRSTSRVAYDEWVVVEEAVVAREIEVGVLGDDDVETSVPGEIVPGDDFYSYADKYEDDAAQLLAPAPLAEATAAVQPLARAAFAACRAEGMARVDCFLEERRRDGSPGRGFLVNEVNTIPGFTPVSMFPRLWALSGVPYPDLLDRLIALAHLRHARRAAARRPSALTGRQRFTTGHVKVRVMPSTAWIWETTIFPRSSRLSASVRTITS